MYLRGSARTGKRGGFDLRSEQLFCVSGFWFRGSGLCPETRALKICGKEREKVYLHWIGFVVDANLMDYRYQSILWDIYR